MGEVPVLAEDERPYHATREYLARQLEQARADKARETARANRLADDLHNLCSTVAAIRTAALMGGQTDIIRCKAVQRLLEGCGECTA